MTDTDRKRVEIMLRQTEVAGRWHYKATSPFTGIIVSGYADAATALIYLSWGLRNAGYIEAADQLDGAK